MTISRRQFLRLAGVVAGGATVSACAPIYRELSGVPQPLGAWPQIGQRAFGILSRLTYGPTVEDRWEISSAGWQAWVEQQLAPDSISDDGIGWRLRSFDSLELEADALVGWEEEQLVDELKRATILRRVYSRKQLYERMVEFWTDHFNISILKGDCWFLKVVDDRDVIRKHALGNFRDLLWASAHSPAMLIYLDNQANEGAAPNENYARELMELHALGVEGGYSQSDVMELARSLTGWTVKDHFWRGEFTFNPDFHDRGSKLVLGRRIEPAGQAEVESVLEHLAVHPATARYLATKLVRRFVTESPRPDLVERVAGTFLATNGSIQETMRQVLHEGLEDPEPKIKRPMDFLASGLRGLAADTDAGHPIQEYLAQMGQSLFEWPTPDGPPDASGYWTSNLMPRWSFAISLAGNEINGTQIHHDQLLGAAGNEDQETIFDHVSDLLLGTRLDATVRDSLLAVLNEGGVVSQDTVLRLSLAGLLASPGFQYF
jgi:uncharacterized protein (DUF1800 family)